MNTLTEFLLQRITEDEAVARGSMAGGGGRWASWNRSWDDGQHRDLAIDGARVATLPIDIDEHVCRHDPVRILAECEAKRRIIELHTKAGADDWYRGSCRICGESDVDYPCDTLKALALPYAEHSDYRAEWAI